jgi:hypothetical protein
LDRLRFGCCNLESFWCVESVFLGCGDVRRLGLELLFLFFCPFFSYCCGWNFAWLTHRAVLDMCFCPLLLLYLDPSWYVS